MSKLDDFDWDFAETIVEEYKEDAEAGVPNSNGLKAPDGTPDITKIKVPQELVEALIEGKSTYNVNEGCTPKKKVVPKRKKSVPQNRDLQEWVNKFSLLLREGQEILQEMTTVGAIGVNMAGTEDKPKKKKKRVSLKDYVLTRRNS